MAGSEPAAAAVPAGGPDYDMALAVRVAVVVCARAVASLSMGSGDAYAIVLASVATALFVGGCGWRRVWNNGTGHGASAALTGGLLPLASWWAHSCEPSGLALSAASRDVPFLLGGLYALHLQVPVRVFAMPQVAVPLVVLVYGVLLTALTAAGMEGAHCPSGGFDTAGGRRGRVVVCSGLADLCLCVLLGVVIDHAHRHARHGEGGVPAATVGSGRQRYTALDGTVRSSKTAKDSTAVTVATTVTNGGTGTPRHTDSPVAASKASDSEVQMRSIFGMFDGSVVNGIQKLDVPSKACSKTGSVQGANHKRVHEGPGLDLGAYLADAGSLGLGGGMPSCAGHSEIDMSRQDMSSIPPSGAGDNDSWMSGVPGRLGQGSGVIATTVTGPVGLPAMVRPPSRGTTAQQTRQMAHLFMRGHSPRAHPAVNFARDTSRISMAVTNDDAREDRAEGRQVPHGSAASQLADYIAVGESALSRPASPVAQPTSDGGYALPGDPSINPLAPPLRKGVPRPDHVSPPDEPRPYTARSKPPVPPAERRARHAQARSWHPHSLQRVDSMASDGRSFASKPSLASHPTATASAPTERLQDSLSAVATPTQQAIEQFAQSPAATFSKCLRRAAALEAASLVDSSMQSAGQLHQLSKEEVPSHRPFDEVLCQLWAAFDPDGTEVLNVTELMSLLEVCGVEMSPEDLSAFFVRAEDGGLVGREAFLELYAEFLDAQKYVFYHSKIHLYAIAAVIDNNSVQSRVMRTWRDYDTDGDENLDQGELVPILQVLNMPHEADDIVELFCEFAHGEKVPDSIDYTDFISIFSCTHPALNWVTPFVARLQEAVLIVGQLEQRSDCNLLTYSTHEQREVLARTREREYLAQYQPVVLVVGVLTVLRALFRVCFMRHHEENAGLLVLDGFSDVVMWLWLLFRLRYPLTDGSFEVVVGPEDMLRHMLTPEHVFDVLLLLPVDWVALGVYGTGYDPLYRVHRMLFAWHLPALVDLATEGLSPIPVRILRALFLLVVQGHCLGCVFNLVSQSVGDTATYSTTTLRAYSELSVTAQFLHSFDYATKTMTGWGRGNPIPDHDEQVLFACLVVITGVASYAFVLACISNALQIPTRETVFRERMDEVKSFLSYVSCPPVMRAQCISYYSHMYSTKGSTDVDTLFLDELPPELDVRMRVFCVRDVLAKVRIFSEAVQDDTFVYALSLKMVDGTLSPGERVTEKGGQGTQMYFITHGVCHVMSADEDEVVYELEQGDFFGEIALLHNVRRTATVRAHTFCNVLVLEKSGFDEVCEYYPNLLEKIRLAAAARMRMIVLDEALRHQRKLRNLIIERVVSAPAALDRAAPPGGEAPSDPVVSSGDTLMVTASDHGAGGTLPEPVPTLSVRIDPASLVMNDTMLSPISPDATEPAGLLSPVPPSLAVMDMSKAVTDLDLEDWILDNKKPEDSLTLSLALSDSQCAPTGPQPAAAARVNKVKTRIKVATALSTLVEVRSPQGIEQYEGGTPPDDAQLKRRTSPEATERASSAGTD
eukprot:TRINITY_DN1619_c0_g1_i2.p1 TRINITY_DN1619_c0_g1~~TRINITY_DN1619_c0_g1_i2.p1  ORF type:complete len:1517 (+),score=408.03 TRINITY_DN1619_c0_g1_i2:96-4646(+)